ncbi:TolC family protein [Mangrovimonas sp. YM274]|uniref:TolC family protein n=1 Tax=Mangrovimonas sp. YM274 TaxID=3070660 RepID=UPI0027DEA71E|nr:TolC family protein [Mangrovimonas sp. YM274]WMI67753.1 TolC family protein [Mangrovimonas sp. YM274]
MTYRVVSIKIALTLGAFFLSLFANAQQLQSLIDEALANSPEIQKFELQYQRVSEKVNEVNTLPNTEFGAGYFVSEPETRTGAQRFKVSVKQMLPWFGSIASREQYVASLADANYEDIVIAKRKLMASVSQSYYNLYANQAKQAVLQEQIQLLESYETMALTSVEVGKASAVDVLRLQMRQNDLQQLKDILQQQFIAEQSNINNLLNREQEVPITVVDELYIPSEDFEVSAEDLKVHPELLKFEKLYQSVEQSNLLNQKERSPMIGFGLDYINVEKRPDMDFSDNGKDIFMPMVSLSIPIFNRKHASVSKQNALQQQELQFEQEARLNTLETLLDKVLTERASARISYGTQSKNLQQAKDAETILIKNYETGTIDFKDVLDIQELQLKFQMAQIEVVRSYYIQSSIINYLIQ